MKISALRLTFGASFYAPFFLLLIGSIPFINNRKINSRSQTFVEYLGALSFPLYILQGTMSSLVFFISQKYQIDDDLSLFIYLTSLFIASAIAVRSIDEPIQNFGSSG